MTKLFAVFSCLLIFSIGCKKKETTPKAVIPTMSFVADEQNVQYSGDPTGSSEFIGVGLYNYGGSATSTDYVISGGVSNTNYMFLGFVGSHPLTKDNGSNATFTTFNFVRNGENYTCNSNCKFTLTVSADNLLSGTFSGAFYSTGNVELTVNNGIFQNVANTQ